MKMVLEVSYIWMLGPIGGTDWKGLGGVAVLEEVCHWLGGFKSPYNSDLDLALSVSLWIRSELSATASQCLPAAMLAAVVMFMDSTMGPMSPLKCFLL